MSEKDTKPTPESTIYKRPLSPAELRVLLLMRSLQPFERIEIKLADDAKTLMVTHDAKVRESFPLD